MPNLTQPILWYKINFYKNFFIKVVKLLLFQALELCRKYLEAEMTQSMAGSDCETPDVKLDYLSRSLELTMLYVDEQSPSLTPALAGSINQAWEILAETLRRICTRGSESF